MQKYATQGTRSRGGAGLVISCRSASPRSPQWSALRLRLAHLSGPALLLGDPKRRTNAHAGRVMTVVSAPLLSSITQRTDLLHGHVPPTRFSLGIAFTPCSTDISPATTLRSVSA